MKPFTSYKTSRGPCFSTQNLEFSRIVILVFIASLFFSALHQTVNAELVHIPDPDLRSALELALGKAAGEDITQADMASFESATRQMPIFKTGKSMVVEGPVGMQVYQ